MNAKPEWTFAATCIALATLPIPNVEGGEAKQKEQEEKEEEEEEDDDIWESLKKIFRKPMTEDRKMHGIEDVERRKILVLNRLAAKKGGEHRPPEEVTGE